MIVEWFVSIGLSVVGWLGSLFSPFQLPSWLMNPTAGIYSVLGSAGGLGAWLPMQALGLTISFAVLVFSAMLTTKLVLFLWSKIPFFGGGGG